MCRLLPWHIGDILWCSLRPLYSRDREYGGLMGKSLSSENRIRYNRLKHLLILIRLQQLLQLLQKAVAVTGVFGSGGK